MSRVSLKKDFKDGEILYGGQVNTNSRAAELSINDNYEEILKLKDIKADVEDMTDALALKVDTSTFDEAIDSLNATKANISLVNTKADKTAVALKADKTYVDSQLETKANISYVDAELSVKADSSDVDTALLLKADKSNTYTKAETDSNIDNRIASGITNKADKTYVDNQLATKANASSLGDISNLNTVNKSSAVAAINEINLKSAAAAKDIDDLSITANASNKMQASGIIDSNSSDVVRTWVGTQAEYNAIQTKNARTLYYINDDYEEPEVISNKTTSITASSTHNQYPSAKAVYDALGGSGPSGDYYTKQETDNLLNGKADTEDIPDLTNYVRNTDYATSNKGGAFKSNSNYGVAIENNGFLTGIAKNYTAYQGASNQMFISKGTLENVITGKDLTTKAYVDGLVGNIEAAIDAIQGEVI